MKGYEDKIKNMKNLKVKNENVTNPLKKVENKSKAIISLGSEERKKEALRTALIAKSKQLKKHSKQQLKVKDKKTEHDSLAALDEVKTKKDGQKKKVEKSDESVQLIEGVPRKKRAKDSIDTTEAGAESSKKEKNTKKRSKELAEANSKEAQNITNDSKKIKKKAKATILDGNANSEENGRKRKKEEEKGETEKSSDTPQEQDNVKANFALKQKKKAVKVEVTEKEKKPSDPECTVFVGNLPQNVKKQQLISLFKSYGKVISVRLRNALGNTLFKHKSRKETECLNAYIVLDTPENALSALKLSGTEFRGRHIRVTKSSKNKSTDESNKRTIFVGNLKHKVTEETLYELFSSVGEIEVTRTVKNLKGCKGIGYVTFKQKEAVPLAQDLNGTLVFGRPMRVEKYSPARMHSEVKKVSEGKSKVNKVKEKGGEPKKKGDFKGVKINIKKNDRKKKWSKKLGGNPIQKKLAKKIAPRNA